MRKSFFNAETISIGVIAVFAAFFLFSTFHLGRTAALFPRMVSTVVLLLSVYYLAGKYRRLQAGAAVLPKPRRVALAWQVMLAAILGYLALVGLFGFGFSTFAYGIVMSHLMGYRNYKVAAAFSLAMALIIVFGFNFLLPGTLPKGLILELIFGGG